MLLCFMLSVLEITYVFRTSLKMRCCISRGYPVNKFKFNLSLLLALKNAGLY